MGYLIAHALRASCPPSTAITLHFHRLRQADTFNAVYGLTVVNPHTGVPVFRDGFHYDMKDTAMRRAVPTIPDILELQRRKEYVPAFAAEKIRTLHEEAKSPPRLDDEGFRQKPIEVVIIAKRGRESLRVVEGIKPRLSRNSTIVLIHNGMGVLSQVQACWPREAERPNIVEGFSTHGLSNPSEFTIHHTSPGAIHIGIAPRLDENDVFDYTSLSDDSLPAILNCTYLRQDPRFASLGRSEQHRSLKYILDALLSDPTLNCTLRAYLPDLYLLQLKRVICQTILQILGALHRCTNIELISVQRNHEIIGKLIKEILPVIDADPLISSSPLYRAHFTFLELYTSVRNMALAAPNAVSLVLQDMAGRRETELGYLSGFLLLLARKRGFKLPTWRVIHELLKAGARLEQGRHNMFVPLRGDGRDEELMGLPDGTGVFEKPYWRLQRVSEEGHVAVPMLKEARDLQDESQSKDALEESGLTGVQGHNVSSSAAEERDEAMELFSAEAEGRSRLSKKLKITSSSPFADTLPKEDRTLPRVRTIRDVYHPWSPYRPMEVAKHKKIKMHIKWRKRRKAARKLARERLSTIPDTSALAEVDGTDLDQEDPRVPETAELCAEACDVSVNMCLREDPRTTTASDSQMTKFILRQLESTNGSTSSKPATLFPDKDDPLAYLFAPEERPHIAESSPSQSSGELVAPSTGACNEEHPHPTDIPITTHDPIEISNGDKSVDTLRQEENVRDIEDITASATESGDPLPLKRRGRPRGSKNSPKQ